MEEIWKDIKNYNDLYQISNFGEIKSLEKERWNGHKFYIVKEKILKKHIVKNGYLYITLYKNKKRKDFRIHRLVAQTFILNSKNKPEVNHKDANKHNNYVDNLEWCTKLENIEHGKKNKLFPGNKTWLGKFGKNHHSSKPVLQFDLNNNFINKFDSMTIAGRMTEINNAEIGMVCNGKRKMAGGFIWKYAK